MNVKLIAIFFVGSFCASCSGYWWSNTRMNIVEKAKSLGATTLVELLEAADLDGVLSQERGFDYYTVFAPTNAAFAALPSDVLTKLQTNKAALQEVLKHHVIKRRIPSYCISNDRTYTSLAGSQVRTNIYGSGGSNTITANGSPVILADQNTCNGIIHVIDTVMYPLPGGTITDIAVADSDFSTLVTALKRASLAGTLAGDGPFTVFAPTNAAFNALNRGVLNGLLRDTDALKEVLLYHVVSGTVYSSGLTNADIVQTLAGQVVTVSVDRDGVGINDATVTVANIPATNGVLHVIDVVLVPPTPTENIVGLASALGATTLASLVRDARLTSTLQRGGPFTVFGPSNEAFDNLPNGALATLAANPALLAEVLTYHVVSGTVESSDLTNDALVTTVEGRDVRTNVYKNSGVVTVNGAKVTLANQRATNGVIHVIDQVLYPIPTQNIVEIASRNAEFTTLVSALTSANLVRTLQGTGPFTVFAPTNDAFAKVPSWLLSRILGDTGMLTDVLTYHVLGTAVFSRGLSNGDSPATVQGSDVKISLSSYGNYVNNARITTVDIVATNGVIHVIDAVLLPFWY